MLKTRDVIKKFEGIGFNKLREAKGSHMIMFRLEDNIKLTFPIKNGKDFSKMIIIKNCKKAGEDFHQMFGK